MTSAPRPKLAATGDLTVDNAARAALGLEPASIAPLAGQRLDVPLSYSLDFLEQLCNETRAEQERLNPRKARRVRRTRTCTPTDTSTIDLGKVAQAALALSQIDPTRADKYETWVEIGMSLSELGAIGLNLWEQWSKQSAKYDPFACGEKWQSFTPGDGVTLNTLRYYAEQEQPEAATVPCRACKANEQIVNVQREKITALETEVKQLRDRNRFITEAQGAKEIKSASMRDTVVELQKEIERVPIEDRDPEQFIPVRPSYMAACANSSPSTVGRHLQRLEKQGYIERRVETKYNHEAGTFVSQTSIRPLVDLSNPGALVVPSEHGGSRKPYCRTCGSSKILKVTTIECEDCETKEVIGREPLDQETYADAIIAEDASVEDAAPCFEQAALSDEGQKTEAGPSDCILQDNNYGPGVNTGFVENVTQDAIHSTPEPSISQRPINSIYRRPVARPPAEYPPGYSQDLVDRLRTMKVKGGKP